jgi:N-acetylmuramoyl-L-alanine amidase/sugar lactone lactonase YvrE
MKKTLFLFLTLFAVVTLSAADLTGIKIYVNPGHGGHDPANDRNIVTIPFPAGNVNGFWESNSNLAKGLALREYLQNAGATVVISRTLNRDEDDRALSSIVAEANASNADAFLSIHSNAGGTTTNYSLMLYAGIDTNDTQQTYPTPTPYSNESRAVSTVIGNNLISNQLTVWTSSTPTIRGDKTFGRTAMGWDDGYGVLRGLTVPGLISEGAFHEYAPEAHRFLNADYCKLEAFHFYKSFCTYFNKNLPATGAVVGWVKSETEKINNPLFTYIGGSTDQWLPLNGATVQLLNTSGTVLKTYTVDNWYNGIFAFYDLTPGSYKLAFEATGYPSKNVDITVTAATVTYARTFLSNGVVTPDPVKIANIYASELAYKGNNTFKFTLNEDAESVTLRLYNTGWTVLETRELGALTKGVHELTNVFSTLTNGNWTWDVTAVAPAVTEPIRITNGTEPQLVFYSPRGIAIDKSFDSPFFGRIYITESLGGTSTELPLPSGGSARTTKDGVYILNATLQDITAQGANPYDGGINWKYGATPGASADGSPMRLTVAPDGKVYVNDLSNSHSGIWIMDPANPNNFTQLFDGTRDVNTGLVSYNSVPLHGSISHCYVTGLGAETTLYTFDDDYLSNGKKGNLLKYTIGTAIPYTTPPTVIYENDGNFYVSNTTANTLNNSLNSIGSDGRGGWWISNANNAVTETAATPALIHVKATGETDFNSFNDIAAADRIGINYRGGMAVSYTGDKVAIASTGSFTKVYTVTFGANDKPSLTLAHSIPANFGNTTGTNSDGMAFDRAGNLYVVTTARERLGVWSLPKADNRFTTAGLPFSVGIPDGIKEVKTGNLDDLVQVYPNPVASELTIAVQGVNVLGYSLYDVNGRIVRSGNGTDLRQRVSLDNLSAGVYILQVKTIEGIVVKRIIKK